MAYLNKIQVEDIINNRPDSLTPEDIVESLVRNGHQLEGLEMSQPKKTLGPSPYETGSRLTSPTFPTPLDVGQEQGIIRPQLRSIGRALGNLPSSALRFAKGLFDTKGQGEFLADVVQSATGLGGKKQSEAATERIAQGFTEQYGSLDKIQRTIEEDPFAVVVALEGGAKLPGIRKITGGKGPIAGFGQFSEKVAPPVKQIVSKISTPISKTIQKKAVDSIANAYRQTAQGTIKPTKQLNKSLARGKDPAQFLAERNLTPDIEDGKIKTAVTQDFLDQSVDPLNEHLNLALQEIEPSIPLMDLEELRAKAIRRVNNIPNQTAQDKAKLITAVNNSIDAEVSQRGRQIGITQVQQIKKANWGKTRFDATSYDRDASYNIGRIAKEMIEEAVPKDKIAVRDLNDYIGDFYDSKQFLASLEGKAVKGGRLGKYFARVIGTGIGQGAAGPIGGFTGLLAGDFVADILQKGTFSNPLKQLILRNLEVNDPIAYQQVVRFLQESGQERLTRKLLPAPKGLSAINEGRPIPVLPNQPGLEYTGQETVVGTYRPKQTLRNIQPSKNITRNSNIISNITDKDNIVNNRLFDKRNFAVRKFANKQITRTNMQAILKKLYPNIDKAIIEELVDDIALFREASKNKATIIDNITGYLDENLK